MKNRKLLAEGGRMTRSRLSRALLAAAVAGGTLLAFAAAPAAAHHVDATQTRPVSVTASDVTLCALGECTALAGPGVYTGDLILTLEGHSNGYTATNLAGASGTCPAGYQAIGWEVTTHGGWLDVGLVFDPVLGDPVGLAERRIYNSSGTDPRGFAFCFK